MSTPAAQEGKPTKEVAKEASGPDVIGGSNAATQGTPDVQLGQTVQYVLPSGPSKGQVRAATVTAVLPQARVNLIVFLDGTKDSTYVTPSGPILTEWFGNVGYAPADTHEFGTYHPAG